MVPGTISVGTKNQEETVRKRLEVYQQQTAPLVEFYKDGDVNAQYSRIEGIGGVDDIKQAVFAALG